MRGPRPGVMRSIAYRCRRARRFGRGCAVPGPARPRHPRQSSRTGRRPPSIRTLAAGHGCCAFANNGAIAMNNILRFCAAGIATSCMAAGCYALAVPANMSAKDRAALAAPLRLAATYLTPADNGERMRTIRDVHPSLQHIDAWISSVGAGAALADIQGSGLAADICLVDPRNNSVSVMPAPDTG